jgi:hypothetical protein
MEEQESTGDHDGVSKNPPVTVSSVPTRKEDKPEQGQQESHRGDRTAKDQPRPGRREGLSLLLSAIVAASTLIYAIVSSCQLLVMRESLAEIRKSNQSSDKVAAAALKVATASENVALATREWSTESGRAIARAKQARRQRRC